jgi:hypothetical protein
VSARIALILLFGVLIAACSVAAPAEPSGGSAEPSAGAARFVVSDLQRVGSDDIGIDDQVQFAAAVSNDGTAAGTFSGTVIVDGRWHTLLTADLAPGQSRMLTFSVVAETAGQHEVTLADGYATFYVGASEAFIVADLVVVDRRLGVTTGQPVTVTAFVQNDGSAGGTYAAELTLDGQVVGSQDVELAPGEARTVEFVIEAGPPGTYELGLGGATALLTVADQPTFTLGDLTVLPELAEPGDEVSVSVTVTNDGLASGTYPVTLTIDGLVEDTYDVTLAGGESTILTFYVTAGPAGTYEVAVEDLAGQLVVGSFERPSNGTVLFNKLRGGAGRLTIENGNDRDALVVLAKESDPATPLLAVYVRADNSRTIKRIKDGTYVLLYSLGENWDSGSNAFTSNVDYRQTGTTLKFKTTRISGGYRYTIWTVTLHTVVGGGTPAIPIGEDDFPTLP